MRETLSALVLTVGLLAVFLASNEAHRHNYPFYVSRKIAHFGAGVVIGTMPLLFTTWTWPATLSLGFLLLLAATHRTELWHGFARPGRIAEVAFALSVLVSIWAAWRVNPWLGVMPGLFMAFGDGISGIVRFSVYHREVKGWWGSLACLGVCAILALLIAPYWVGLVGAVAFTVAEKLCGDVGRIKVDDNLVAPLFSLAVMLPLYFLAGG